jgi:hypothetical protein
VRAIATSTGLPDNSCGSKDRLNRVPVQHRLSVRVVIYNYEVLLSCIETVMFYLILTCIIMEFSSQRCQQLRLRIVGGKIISERGNGKIWKETVCRNREFT